MGLNQDLPNAKSTLYNTDVWPLGKKKGCKINTQQDQAEKITKDRKTNNSLKNNNNNKKRVYFIPAGYAVSNSNSKYY